MEARGGYADGEDAGYAVACTVKGELPRPEETFSPGESATRVLVKRDGDETCAVIPPPPAPPHPVLSRSDDNGVGDRGANTEEEMLSSWDEVGIPYEVQAEVDVKVDDADVQEVVLEEEDEYDIQEGGAHVEVTMVPCPFCNRQFLCSSVLRRHIDRRHSPSCSTSATSSSSSTKRHRCPACPYATDHGGDMRDHRRTHTGEKPFTCPVCHRGFTQSGNLRTHVKIHSGERPFACARCGRAFARLSHCENHERTHTGERPYGCGDCGKTFALSGALLKHRRTHTGEKPFACTNCGKAFVQLGNLHRHRRTHHTGK